MVDQDAVLSRASSKRTADSCGSQELMLQSRIHSKLQIYIFVDAANAFQLMGQLDKHAVVSCDSGLHSAHEHSRPELRYD